MTPFEKKYLIYCLKEIKEILSNPNKLTAAIAGYTQGRLNDVRYLHNRNISNACSWTSQNQLSISAALFEAHAKASQKFCTQQNEEEAKQIQQAYSILLTDYISLITQDVRSARPLHSVQENIDKVLVDLTRKEVSITDNSFSWFSVAAGALTVTALAAAYLIQPESPSGRR